MSLSLSYNGVSLTSGGSTLSVDLIYQKINPNPAGDATLTALGILNQYYTRAELSALYSYVNAIFYPPDDGNSIVPALVYASNNTLTDREKDILDIKVRR